MESITGLSHDEDETTCYRKLVELLHPNGLACPRCHARDGLGIHRRRRDPVLDYQCAACGRVFNAWTGTILQGRQRHPSQILRILRGMELGTPTARLARELGCSRGKLIELRRRLQGHPHLAPDPVPRRDADVPDGPANQDGTAETEAPPTPRSAASAGAAGPGQFDASEVDLRHPEAVDTASEWIRLGRRLCSTPSPPRRNWAV